MKTINPAPKVRISEPLFHTVCRFMDAMKHKEGFASGLDLYIEYLKTNKGASDAQSPKEAALRLV